jgi:predicted metal-dependent hydrolase
MSEKNDAPLIVLFVADMMSGTRIAQTAQKLGFRVQFVEKAEDIAAADEKEVREAPGERLHGRQGRLFAQVSAWQPALLVFDLTNTAVPWQKWLPVLKSSPATRRFPILAFGPHVEAEMLKEAKRLGASFTYPRSKFFRELPDLLQQHARVPDTAAIADACAEPLAPLAQEGVQLFNEGEFYKCHDALEEAWMADKSAGRELYRGILQVGIAYFQIQRGNYRGAVKMLLRVRQWLEPLPAVCRGVNVGKLRAEANAVHAALTELGPQRLEEFDQTMFKPIELV